MEGSSKIKVKEPQNAPKTTLKSIKKINKKLHQILNGIFNGFWTHFGTILDQKCSPKLIQKSMHFSLKKNIENSYQNDLILGGQGGSNEPAFRSLNLCWGQPGAQGDPRAPQGRPGHRPGSQHFPKWSSKCPNNDPKTTPEIPN